eukprot:5367984-Pyramimonas_sp.AAC.1
MGGPRYSLKGGQGPQEPPKRPPRGPQEAPKRPPRGPQEAPRASNRPPRGQEAPRRPKRHPRGPKETPKSFIAKSHQPFGREWFREPA